MTPTREAAARRKHALTKTQTQVTQQGPFHFRWHVAPEPINCVAAAIERVLTENA